MCMTLCVKLIHLYYFLGLYNSSFHNLVIHHNGLVWLAIPISIYAKWVQCIFKYNTLYVIVSLHCLSMLDWCGHVMTQICTKVTGCTRAFILDVLVSIVMAIILFYTANIPGGRLYDQLQRCKWLSIYQYI